MSGRVAARDIACVVLCLLAVLGGPAAARSQSLPRLAMIEAPAASSRQAPEPFGFDTAPVTSGELPDKWNGVAADIRADREVLLLCRLDVTLCPEAAQKFLDLVAQGSALAGRARLGTINRAINLAIQPMSDLAQWGVVDRWSAPLVTLSTGRGDCEDYAIAKYVALGEAGVAEDDMRLVIVHDPALGQDHAVLTVRLDDKWIVLDNRRMALLDDAELPHVVPLFVLARAGVRQFAPAAIADGHGAHAPMPSALGY